MKYSTMKKRSRDSRWVLRKLEYFVKKIQWVRRMENTGAYDPTVVGIRESRKNFLDFQEVEKRAYRKIFQLSVLMDRIREGR